MSTLKQELYRHSLMSLTRSIVLKDHSMADLANREIKASGAYGNVVIDEDPRTWRYYLNMAGQYHYLDEPMDIVSLDTREIIPFTTDSLFKHRATIKEYTLDSQYYTDLLARYPLQKSLIRGILDPVDLETAIAAPDYTILSYDDSLVEAQEYNLIFELQQYIYKFIDRWKIKDYSRTDYFYPAMLTARLWQTIPLAIQNIRLSNIKTYKAHSFHIWNYLDSHGSLSRYQDYLTLPQTMWLYRNIKWVFTNAGKSDTHLALMDIILSSRGIPLGSFSVRHSTEFMPESLSPAIEAVRRPMNLKNLSQASETIRSLRFVMEKENGLAKDNESVLESDLSLAENSLPYMGMSEVPIKAYESDWIDTADNQVYKLDDVLITHWAWFAHTKQYTSVINVRNPYTNELMTLGVKDAFLLWLYIINKRNGITLENVPEVQLHRVYRTPPRYTALKLLDTKDAMGDGVIDFFLDNQPVVGSVISTEAFNEMTTDIHDHMLLHHKLWSIQHKRDTRAAIELMCSKAYFDTRIKFFEETKNYDEYLTEQGYEVSELITADLDILIVDIYNLALGIDLSNKKSLKDIQFMMLQLMRQLGTYDTHYLASINNSAAMALDTQAIRINDPLISTRHNMRVAPVSIDRVEVSTHSHYLFDLAHYDLTVAKVKSFDINTRVNIPMEVMPNMRPTSARVRRFDCRLSTLKIEWPNKGDLGDILIVGDITDLEILPLDGDDLAKLVLTTQLNGLYFDDDLAELLDVNMLNGLIYKG